MAYKWFALLWVLKEIIACVRAFTICCIMILFASSLLFHCSPAIRSIKENCSEVFEQYDQCVQQYPASLEKCMSKMEEFAKCAQKYHELQGCFSSFFTKLKSWCINDCNGLWYLSDIIVTIKHFESNTVINPDIASVWSPDTAYREPFMSVKEVD